MDSLTVWNVVLAVLLLLVMFMNGVSVGLLLVKWGISREWRGTEDRGRKAEDEGSDAQQRVPTGSGGVWQVVDGEWRRVGCGDE